MTCSEKNCFLCGQIVETFHSDAVEESESVALCSLEVTCLDETFLKLPEKEM